MRTSLSRVATTIVVGILVVACAPTSTPRPLATSSLPGPSGPSTPAASPPPVTTPPQISPPAADSPTNAPIAAGHQHTCAITSGGGVACWGSNVLGQLGNGTRTDSSVPVDVSGLSSVSMITAAVSHTCAVVAAGGVKCWGNNNVGGLGNGTTTEALVPVDVSGLARGVTALAAGQNHTCAVSVGGGVKCWGYNGYGQLGNGLTANSGIPVDTLGLATGVTRSPWAKTTPARSPPAAESSAGATTTLANLAPAHTPTAALPLTSWASLVASPRSLRDKTTPAC